MAGISNKAAERLENRFKFNEGTELNNDLDINFYETDFRSLDPQLGRFHQLDPLGELFENESLYSFAGNNPISYNDPYGLSKSKDSASLKKPEPKPKPKPPAPIPPPPSLGGLQPLPIVPNQPGPKLVPQPTPPAQTPGKLIRMFEPSPLPWGGIFSRFFGTMGGLLIPIPTGEGASLPKGYLDPYKGHGNNKDNTNPHIVYQFTFTPPEGDNRTPVLKYGISDEYRYGFDRPENQRVALIRLYGPTVTWILMSRTKNRAEALLLESIYVTQHNAIWREMPRAQIRPIPK